MSVATAASSAVSSPKYDRKSVLSWCFYDWGSSAFATVIITFVFSVYFSRRMVGDETLGAAQWSFAIAISGIAIAVLSPILGGLTDYFGSRKPWIMLFTILCSVATAFLYFGVPGASPGNILFVLTMLVIANTAFEIAIVFNNAMLPCIVREDYMGRVSGWAWGMGYMGGLCCLVLSLLFLAGLGDMKPLLPLPTEKMENIRAVAPLVALWVLIFMIPLMRYTHDVPRTALPMQKVLGHGVHQLRQMVRDVRHHGNLVRFLVSSAIYRDGLNTLFAVGGLYAAGTFGMSFQEILLFAIGLNITAGLGAAGFAYMDDLRGSKQTVILSLLGLLFAGLAVLLVQDKALFIGLAMVLGLFIGPVQSASRTMAARLSSPEHIGQTFGLYSLTGRVVSFMGPAAYGWATLTFDSQRAGVATILLFWLVGMVLLFTVREEERDYDRRTQI